MGRREVFQREELERRRLHKAQDEQRKRRETFQREELERECLRKEQEEQRKRNDKFWHEELDRQLQRRAEEMERQRKEEELQQRLLLEKELWRQTEQTRSRPEPPDRRGGKTGQRHSCRGGMERRPGQEQEHKRRREFPV